MESDKKRHAYTFFESFHDAMRNLSDEQYGSLMRGMNEFALYGNEPEFADVVENMVWKLVRPILEKSRNKIRKSSANQSQSERKSSANPIMIYNQGQDKGYRTKDNRIKDKKEREDKRENDNASGGSLDYESFIQYYNSIVEPFGLPTLSELSNKRKKELDAIAGEFGKQAIIAVLEKVKYSEYLTGCTSKKFKANFDWIFKRENFVKIKEGNYDD